MTDSPLRLLLAFDAQAQRDRTQPPAFLHRRDRKFALLSEEQGTPRNAVRWLSHLERLSGGATARSSVNETLALWRRINTGFAAIGLVAGVMTMSGLLFYEGGQRINITVLMAFVVLHMVLALLTSLQSLAGWQPWGWLLRRFQSQPADGVAIRLQPLLMAKAAHLGGLCFATAGLLTLLAMVVVQDLAFGWSTTLDTAASSYHRLVQVVSTPWAWLWPAAAPDFSLVDATRFFRAGDRSAPSGPALWGQWWPFVTMLWVTWVLLPRLVLLLLATALIRHKAHSLLARHPAMQALLYRMETPALDTGNAYNDAADQPDTRIRDHLFPLPESDILLCWAGAGEPELPDTLRSGKHLIVSAGGKASLAQDTQALQQIADHLKTPAKAIILLVRAWEPPTGELQDFLESARSLWPDQTRVAIVPLAADIHREPDAHQIQPWLRFAERVGNGFVQISVPAFQWRDPYTASGAPL